MTYLQRTFRSWCPPSASAAAGLTATDSRRLITLDVPVQGPICFEGVAARYEQIESSDAVAEQGSYLLAMSIRRIGENDRARYVEYMRSIG